MADPTTETTEAVTPPPDIPAAEPLPMEPLRVDLADYLPETARPMWETLVAYPWLLLPLLLLLGWGLGRLLEWTVSRSLTQITSRTRTTVDDKLVPLLSRPIMPVVFILSLMAGVNTLPLPDGLNDFVIRALATMLILIVVRTALSTVRLILEVLSVNRKQFRLIEERTIPLFDMVSKILLVGAAAYAFLLVWGIDPTAWLASAGIIGIAVGFAARDSLANLFAGMFIVADAPYKIGDYIVLDTSDRGMVTHVGMRSTRILTRDDLEITIPNAVIANAKLINESGGPWVKSRIRMRIGVAYGTDLDRVCKLLVFVAEEHSGILTNPAPRVRLREFAESSIVFELMGWIAHPEQRGLVTHEVMMAVYTRLRGEGIEIPYPKRDLYIREMPGKKATGLQD